MICPICSTKKTRVTNVRPHKQRSEIWRRRLCQTCSLIFTTYETPHVDAATKVYDSTLKNPEVFNIGILVIDIANCFKHNPKLGRSAAYSLARTAEVQLLQLVADKEKALLTKELIKHTTHAVLQRFDNKAAIQYAAHQNLL